MSNLKSLIMHEVKTYSQFKSKNSTFGVLHEKKKTLKLFGNVYSIINKFTSQLPYN